MLEESLSIWAAMNSWLTPSVFFVFLNLMIGTIFITSRPAKYKPSDQHQEQEKHVQAQYGYGHQLTRSPSVLQKLKPLNLLYSYRSQEPPAFTFEKPQESDQRLTFHQQDPQQDHQYHQNQNQTAIIRSPPILQRIKSISVYNYFSQEPSNPSSTKNHKNEESTPTHLTSEQIYDQIQEHDEQLQEEEEEWFQDEENERVQDEEQTIEEIYSKLQGGKLSKSTSDTKPSSGELPKKLPKKMRKSASAKSAFSHFEEEDIVESRRPATVREGKPSNEVGDTEVDAKADDFINKFKQQLKLQRTDSFIRYTDMINGGS